MIGLILAAGAGRRLRPLTDDLPKALLPVCGDVSLLEASLHNLRDVGIDEAVVVTGHAGQQVAAAADRLTRRTGVGLCLVHNDHALDRNNAYSLWLARDAFFDGALLVNGDTLHPTEVEERLLAARGPDVLLAVDTTKRLGAEEMKVVLDRRGDLVRISKQVPVRHADGEYIGVAVIEPWAAVALADALAATWQRDPDLYYEDGFAELVGRGGRVGVAPIGEQLWCEVDDHRDLARARAIAARVVRTRELS